MADSPSKAYAPRALEHRPGIIQRNRWRIAFAVQLLPVVLRHFVAMFYVDHPSMRLGVAWHGVTTAALMIAISGAICVFISLIPAFRGRPLAQIYLWSAVLASLYEWALLAPFIVSQVLLALITLALWWHTPSG